MSKVYLVTGANSGVGKDACRQLALLDDTKKVYLCARSEEKAKKAIADLVSSTSTIDGNKLQAHHFDPNESKQDIIRKTVKSLPEDFFHGVILNAGSRGALTPSGPNNVTPIAQVNVIGHVHLVDGLLAAGKIGTKKGDDSFKSRVVYIGSETAKGGGAAKSPGLGEKSEQDICSILNGDYYKNAEEKDDTDGNTAYGAVKGVGTLYFSGFGRAHPETYTVTVSPGGTAGTEFLSNNSDAFGGPFVAFLAKYVVIPVLLLTGFFHKLEVGAKRYVDAVVGKENGFEFETGTFVASKRGVSGSLSDQAKTSGPEGIVYGDIDKQDMVYNMIQNTYA
ncbi:short chain dehydrogenase [Seminavis robusta]|uniref:Short chain dehydrogenase n=1 Tax=Seminavis robusta TaxID=568900 RepID=A0A9N8HFS0_9STRA|nr:short chain dehydrogenase [Seminavis robusta]|eukprot:Sro538_g162530.1 short chain dehydrogenase (335) ;mRNA; r:15221-16225